MYARPTIVEILTSHAGRNVPLIQTVRAIVLVSITDALILALAFAASNLFVASLTIYPSVVALKATRVIRTACVGRFLSRVRLRSN